MFARHFKVSCGHIHIEIPLVFVCLYYVNWLMKLNFRKFLEITTTKTERKYELVNILIQFIEF